MRERTRKMMPHPVPLLRSVCVATMDLQPSSYKVSRYEEAMVTIFLHYSCELVITVRFKRFSVVW
jgi:hypothetical protein